MRTSKDISTISYNTSDFLKSRLDLLISTNVIDFYMFINHIAEDDEKKDHIHLYVLPSKLLDTCDLSREFIQDVENGLPLKCMPWRFSDFDDMILYMLHDVDYLDSKGYERRFHYTLDDIVSSDDDYVRDRYKELRLEGNNWITKVVNAMDSGMTFEQFVLSGRVPVTQISNYSYVWNIVQTEREKNF